MAALTGTLVFTSPNIFGRYRVACVSTTTGIGGADQWLPRSVHQVKDMKCAWIVASGANGPGTATSIVLNARGTGVAEGANSGDLGIETTAAITAHVFIVGR